MDIRTAMDHVKTLKHAHSAAVSAGDVIVYNGNVLVAVNNAAQDEENVWIYEARKVEVAKAGSLAIDPGDKVHWVAASSHVNKTASGNTACGRCVEPAAEADTTVIIELLPN